MQELNDEECFRRVWSRVPVEVDAEGVERDLFAGIELEAP